MAFVEDLQPCTGFPAEWGALIAVGWLAKRHPFPLGPADPRFLRRLDALLVSAWQLPPQRGGSHDCDLGGDHEHGSRHLFVPGEGVLYAAPELIGHFVRAHAYAPPEAFVQAVMRCPSMNSPEYLAAVTPFFGPGGIPDQVRITLEGVESVRLRPGMYVGSTGAYGLRTMLLELVGNSVDQHLAGKASRLHVDVDADGWVAIEDDGSGIPVEPQRAGPTGLEVVFTTLHSGPTLDGHEPHIHVRARGVGVGAGVVGALSSRLEVATGRAGVEFTAAFERGRIVEAPRPSSEVPRRGTRIRYLADPEIFKDARLDLDSLATLFSELGSLLPRLDLRLQGRSFQRRDGLSGWVRELAPRAVTESALSASGTVDDVGVEFALAWAPRGKEPRFRSFVNYGETQLSGTHVQGLLDAVRATAPSEDAAQHALKGLVGVVHVTLLHPRFGGPTKATLQTEAARTAVSEIVSKALLDAPWWWDRLLERMRTHAARRSRK